MELVNGRRVAHHLDVKPSAVTNWIKRGILPRSLKPIPVESGPGQQDLYVWRKDQLAVFTVWYSRQAGRNAAKRARAEKKNQDWIREFTGELVLTVEDVEADRKQFGLRAVLPGWMTEGNTGSESATANRS